MKKAFLQIDPKDNIAVALDHLKKDQSIAFADDIIKLNESIAPKQKFSLRKIHSDEAILMYGHPVGIATRDIHSGQRISKDAIRDVKSAYSLERYRYQWTSPDHSKFIDRTFLGYERRNGKAGTRNIWLVIPLVFCENRNVALLRETMLEKLGYPINRSDSYDIGPLIEAYRKGEKVDELLSMDLNDQSDLNPERVFENVDGIRFLTHEGGCGGTREDARSLCGLLAGYIANSNVAGATILSLGCQNAQQDMLREAIQEIAPGEQKRVIFLEEQDASLEQEFMARAIKETFVGLIEANQVKRTPVPLSKLIIGLECGGSDGFSGISANPAVGYVSDLLVSLGAKVILSEFPELHGVEQELISRCTDKEIAQRFVDLMERYRARLQQVNVNFDANPSPGNIREGLLTGAMKSAGAAKKGGSSPVVDVLDYTEQVKKEGLNLLCTPGNDVESTTAMVGSGANMILFTTGLGTPTGNPVSPTIKISSNSTLYQRMIKMIDIDAGTIITEGDTIQSKAEELLNYIIKCASGETLSKGEILQQYDFIPWKRGFSL